LIVETTMFTRSHFSRHIALGAGFVMACAATGVAQTVTPDTRWQPWIGCWQASQIGLGRTAPFVCVTPTPVASAVQIATIDSGKIVARDTVYADDSQRALAKGGCSGWQRANFSADAKRVYLRSELTCGTGLKRSGTGLLSISPDGEWLDDQSMTVAGASTVRATRFHAAKVTSAEVPAEIAAATAGREMLIEASRASAGAPISSGEIIEAVKQLDTAVVQTWIVQRGRKFTFDAKALMALADAGVPGSVTDVLIGVSYPEHFALQDRPATALSGGAMTPLDSARLASQYLSSRCLGSVDPYWGSSLYDPCASRYGLSSFYNPYRYGSYGYNPYGYGYGYGTSYVGYGPVVVVKGDTPPHGRVVNGHGYTRSGDASTTASRGSYGSGSSSSSGSGSAGSASSGSSSSGSSSGEARTAHGRP
jgi:hypothetical protein